MEGTYACFIDCAKAFDRVKPSEMVKALARTGVDGKDIRIISEIYWNQKAAIRVDQELSEPVAIQRGVRQGCVFIPVPIKYIHRVYLPGIKSHEWPQHQRYKHQQYKLRRRYLPAGQQKRGPSENL